MQRRLARSFHAVAATVLLASCGSGGEDAAVGEATVPTAEEVQAGDPAPAELAGVERLREMRAQIARIDMDVDATFLSDEEREVVNLLIEAANLMSDIYLRQVSPFNPDTRAEIGRIGGEDGELALDLFDLHFGPWDTLDEDKAFFGESERAEGAGFYPPDMTKAEFEAWIDANPGDGAAFRSGYTVIRRNEAGGLVARAYSDVYGEWLEAAADKLRAAAAISTNESMKRFLTLRADAFLSDDYYESELAWMDLDGPIEVAIGPYEVYDDRLFGYKTAFEAFITLRDPEKSAALDKYKGLLRDMEANLPVDEAYKNFRRGFASPIAVVTQVHGGGDNVPGVQTIAFNLPNDERVREAKGAKKVILSNVLGAKFERILAPMAGRVLVPEQATLLMKDYMSAGTLFHELAHSLGPGSIVKDGRETTVGAELQELYSGVEEGKADVMGAYNILYMMDRGELPAAERRNHLATYFVGLFRSVRFGVDEAHGQGAAFQYAYLREKEAFAVDAESGLFRIDFDRMEQAIDELTRDIVVLQGDGDYDAAAAFLERYARLDDDARRIVATLADLPVDIQPVYPEKL